MSQARLLDLRNRLMLDGWEINRRSADDMRDDPTTKNLVRFSRNDEFVWHITHPERCVELDIEFQLVGHFGGPPAGLEDLFCCIIKNLGTKLYFSKINTDTWRNDLDAFVAALRDYTKKT